MVADALVKIQRMFFASDAVVGVPEGFVLGQFAISPVLGLVKRVRLPPGIGIRAKNRARSACALCGGCEAGYSDTASASAGSRTSSTAGGLGGVGLHRSSSADLASCTMASRVLPAKRVGVGYSVIGPAYSFLSRC